MGRNAQARRARKTAKRQARKTSSRNLVEQAGGGDITITDLASVRGTFAEALTNAKSAWLLPEPGHDTAYLQMRVPGYGTYEGTWMMISPDLAAEQVGDWFRYVVAATGEVFAVFALDQDILPTPVA